MNIFIVDDEPLIRQRLIETISWVKIGCKIIGEAENGLEAIALIHKLNPDIIITDIRMPGLSGLELIEKIKPDFPEIKFILLTGYNDFKYAQTAVKLGAFDFVLKPTDENEILQIVEKAVNEIKRIRENVNNLPNVLNTEPSEISNSQGGIIIREVIKYIKNNISEDISLNLVAQSVYVNPTYLCRLIKKETGKNFTDIVLDYRIEKAKELLKDIHFKTYEVGQMVGFTYSRNFSKKFKQIVGITPKDYRDRVI